jgi:Fe-S-cluster containining protein
LLLRVVDDAMAEVSRRAGEHLACRAGCTECCIGPFPVTALDALRLRQGLEELAARDPARAAEVRRRAAAAMEAMRASFPGDAAAGRLDDEVAPEHPFWTEFGGAPCPALDPSTGLCDLYAHRPVACRGFGPPGEIDGHKLPPCRLCFQNAAEEEIEACRVRLDPDDIQALILVEMGNPADTVIAAALSLDLSRDTGSVKGRRNPCRRRRRFP